LTLAPLEDWAAQIGRNAQISFGGAQTLDQLAPARYALRLSNLGETCAQLPAVLDLTGGVDGRPVTVQVARAGSIRGRLTGAPNPAAFAVTLAAAEVMEGAPALQTGFPDAEGRFAFLNLRPGRYYLSAQAPAEGALARWVPDISRMQAVDVAGGAPMNIEIKNP
jgi:hypothetical protein